LGREIYDWEIPKTLKKLGKWDNSRGIWGFLRLYLKIISFMHFFGMTFCPDSFFCNSLLFSICFLKKIKKYPLIDWHFRPLEHYLKVVGKPVHIENNTESKF
jgi:hypothetical protein